MTGLYWQGRVLRAMGEWMGAHEPQDWRIGPWWLAVHAIHIRYHEVEVEWVLLRCDSDDPEEMNAGTTTVARHDPETGDVTDDAWWESMYDALLAECGLREWSDITVQMAARRYQCIEWEATH